MGNLNYFTLVIFWAVPVILLQWLIGLDVLIQRWRVWIPGILVPTLYLTVAVTFPLGGGTWTINPTQSLGILIPVIDVPLEEIFFFLVVNALVVQTFILSMYWALLLKRARYMLRLVRRGPTSLKNTEANEPKNPEEGP